MLVIMTNPKNDSISFEKAYAGEDVDWDEVYKGFNAAVDFPTCGFYKVLMQKYPDAKIVHTTRDPEKWYKSAMNTIYQFEKDRPTDLPQHVKQGAHMASTVAWQGVFQGKFEDKEAMLRLFDEHEKDVRRSVPADRLLIFETGKDGWEKLCPFLGKDIPNKPWPHMNTTEEFQIARVQMEHGDVPPAQYTIQDRTADAE
jgi:hypothetical protein